MYNFRLHILEQRAKTDKESSNKLQDLKAQIDNIKYVFCIKIIVR